MRGEVLAPKESLRDLRVEGRKGYFVRSENKIVFVTGRNPRASTSFYFGNGVREPW